jgi:protein phosphatase
VGVVVKIDFAYYTNKGRVRSSNQDALFLNGFGVLGEMRYPMLGDANLEKAVFSVVDGAGGHARGEVASQTIVGEFIKRADALLPDAEALLSNFSEIQDVMTDMSKNPALSGMAAALSGVVLCPPEITVFNVGDCRTYRLHQGSLQKLTHDHSIVQALRDAGKIGSDDEMRAHPLKNQITSSLMAGASKPPEVYVAKAKTEGEETLFICSDGVWESLRHEDMEKILVKKNLSSPADLRSTAQKLAKALMASECRDNVSFIIIKTLLKRKEGS